MTLAEAEQAVIRAAIAHRERKAREPDWSTNEPTDYYNELAALVAETDRAVDVLLALRSTGAGGEAGGEASEAAKAREVMRQCSLAFQSNPCEINARILGLAVRTYQFVTEPVAQPEEPTP